MIRSRLLYVLLFCFFLEPYSLLGSPTRGYKGGHGVVCLSGPGSPIRLLDYWEADAAGEDIFLGPDDLSFREKIDIAIGRLARLDSRRAAYYRFAAQSLIERMRFSDAVPWTADASAEIPAGCDLIQLSVQVPKRFQEDTELVVSNRWWSLLSKDQQAGLIVHHVIYQDAGRRLNVSPTSVRLFNMKISSRSFESTSANDYRELLSTTEFDAAYWIYEGDHDAAGQVDIQYFLADETAIYWWEWNQGRSESVLKRIRRADHSSTPENILVFDHNISVRDMKQRGSKLLLLVKSHVSGVPARILEMDKTTRALRKVIDLDAPFEPKQFEVHGDFLYWTGRAGGLYRIHHSGGRPQVIVDHRKAVTDYVIGEGVIYFLQYHPTSGHPDLFRIDLRDNTLVLVPMEFRAAPDLLGIDGEWLLWSEISHDATFLVKRGNTAKPGVPEQIAQCVDWRIGYKDGYLNLSLGGTRVDRIAADGSKQTVVLDVYADPRSLHLDWSAKQAIGSSGGIIVGEL